MGENLKPCPFCGSTKLKFGEKKIRKSYDGKCRKVIMSVRCNVCKARGEPYSRIVNEDNRDDAYFDLYTSATANWNRRARNI